MPTTVFACPGCKTKYPWRDELAGRKLKCKKCGQSFQIKPKAQPTPAGQAPPAPPAREHPAAEPVGGSLLDEEFAAGALSAAQPAAQPAAPEATPEPQQGKRPCPLCENLVEAGRERCPICKTRMDRPLRDPEAERRKEESREWLFVLAGLGGALLATPLLFLAIVLLFGKGSGPFAFLICAIEVNYIVAIGCFALACRVFRQEPPEIGDILRVVAFATLSSNVIFSWIGGTGFLWTVAATGVAAVIAAVLCMTQLEMPVFPSIFIAFTYNVFAAIFTVIGMVLLGLVFAGYLIGSGEAPMMDEFDSMEMEQEDMSFPGYDEEEFDEEFAPEDDSEVRAEPAAVFLAALWQTPASGLQIERPMTLGIAVGHQAKWAVEDGRPLKPVGVSVGGFEAGRPAMMDLEHGLLAAGVG